jgi:trimeric autotransporter adhesin
MKKNRGCLLAVVIILLTCQGYTQQVAINEDGSSPNLHAILDIKSFNKGVLIPRMSTANRLGIPNTKGLLVYDTTIGSFWYNTGTLWQSLAGIPISGSGWMITGNSGITDSNFLGTTDFKALRIRVNSVPSGQIDPITSNTSWGYRAGNSNNGQNNTSTGVSALSRNLSTGTYNTAVGAWAMQENTTGSYNTATGSHALLANNGVYNSAFGAIALYSNTSGTHNTAAGFYSMNSNLSGVANTAYGTNSLQNNISGHYNTAVGYLTLQTVNSGSQNTAIGAYANISGIGNLTNATAIGFTSLVTASNKVRIGNSAVTVIEGQVPFSTPSDGRFKYGVRDDVKGLDFILKLRPVTYNFDVKRFDEQQRIAQNDSATVVINDIMKTAYDEAAAIRRSGFIAQDVEKAAKAAGYTFSGIIAPKTEQDHFSLSYESFVVPLVKAVQEQQQIIADLQKQLAELKQLLLRSK